MKRQRRGVRTTQRFEFRHVPLSVLVLTAVTAFAVQPAAAQMPAWDQEANLLMHIAYLASDARDGRGIGTPGLDSSAVYLAGRFEQYGLEPLFDGRYEQPFDMNWGIKVNSGGELDDIRSSPTHIATDEQAFLPRDGFQVLGFTGSGTVTAPVVFAGYGISAPEYEYDDYEEIDVTGKIVMVMEGEPNEDDPDSKLEGRMQTQHAVLRNKAITAKVKGAAGMIVVRGPNRYGVDVNKLPELRTDEPYRDVGIPSVFLAGTHVDTLFGQGRMAFDLAKAQRSIDANEAPRSMELRQVVTIAVDVERRSKRVKNIGAKLSGNPDDLLIVGAHYDHLGYGQSGSTQPDTHAVHNGADDNASGTAVLLEIARRLAGSERWAGDRAHPTVWFVAFTGEEVGLVGSNHFVSDPPDGFDHARFMLNLDMVGRLGDHPLTVLGVESAVELKDLLEDAAAAINLPIAASGGGYGPSDQTSFYAKGIPVAHLMASTHSDYHSPRDDIAEIDGAGLVKVLEFATAVLDRMAEPGLTLTYKSAPAPSQGGARGGIHVTLGIIPNFATPDSLHGMGLQGVRPGTPAEKAGLKTGDLIVRMDDVVVDNIYDLTYALRQYNPGDTARIYYMRNGEEHKTTTTLIAKSGGGGHGSGSPHSGSRAGHPGGHPEQEAKQKALEEKD
ncbi:M28 family peptidase [bacterium]|nr:M28 family peptidase [bacterium]